MAVKAGCEPAGGEAEQEDWGQVVGRAQGEQGQGVQAQEEQLHRRARAVGGPVGVEGEQDDGRAADPGHDVHGAAQQADGRSGGPAAPLVEPAA